MPQPGRTRRTLPAAARVAVTAALSTALASVVTPAMAMAPAMAPATAPSTAPETATAPTDAGATARLAPRLRVRTVLRGLDHPWDVTFTPSGAMLVTQRERGSILVRRPSGRHHRLVRHVPHLWVSEETGLEGIVVDPRFGTNHRFYTCQGHVGPNGGHDVRVVAWRAGRHLGRAHVAEVLVKGFPTSTGRHGGCRLRFGNRRVLYVGTGDSAQNNVSRNLRSLGGKTLRIDPDTGHAVPGNPFMSSPYPRTRKIWTYGHRNVQGLALRPHGVMWSVEHGTYRDDEVNRLRKGGDYGWQPGPGYDESAPMTDFSLPGRQTGARWSSGNPTDATSGAGWLTGRRWGHWQGALAVAALKDSSLRVIRFDRHGRLRWVRRPPALTGTYGRLRTAQIGPHHVLYLTTDNGSGQDRVLAVRPAR